jgi:hypothetical protein
LLKRNRFQFPFALRVQKFCAGENLDAFAPENLFNFNSGIGVELLQNVPAALDERDLDAEAREELRELARNRAAAEDDERLRQPLQRQRVVAGDEADFVELRQRRRRDAGAGGDDEMFGGISW